jgi:putative endonuclease
MAKAPRKAQTGREAEQCARRYLERRGLRHLTGNYRCRQGELDLVMVEGNTLVFVEVRYRSDARFGTGAESVNVHKQRRLIYAAQHYLQRHPRLADRPCRFDVVAIGPANRDGAVEWIRNAFEVS